MVLRAEHIFKKISGKDILVDINLEFESGKIYGICGKNACGKTMLLRALSGLMKIDSGCIFLDNKLLHKDFSILPNLGLTLENAGMFPSLTGFENLKMLAKINGKIKNDEIRTAMKRVGLNSDDKRVYRKYSLGMKQRLAIAQAIMEYPDIIFLDEPTNGLDENGVILIREILQEERIRGALILIVSHNKEDLEELCDKNIQIKDGRICI